KGMEEQQTKEKFARGITYGIIAGSLGILASIPHTDGLIKKWFTNIKNNETSIFGPLAPESFKKLNFFQKIGTLAKIAFSNPSANPNPVFQG
ncbi:MAG: hypothetical protein Q7S14_02010, partial [bacterium]|nr:hypothetical protein [bacterium]